LAADAATLLPPSNGASTIVIPKDLPLPRLDLPTPLAFAEFQRWYAQGAATHTRDAARNADQLVRHLSDSDDPETMNLCAALKDFAQGVRGQGSGHGNPGETLSEYQEGAAPIEEEVADLSAALAREWARLRVPGHEALWTTISKPTGRAVAKLITRIERECPELFGRYGSLEELYVAIVDVFDHEQPSVSSAADLFDALEAVAEETWVIASPLANLMPPAKLDPLGTKLALVAVSHRHGDWLQIREEVNAHFVCDIHQLDSRLEHDRDKKSSIRVAVLGSFPRSTAALRRASSGGWSALNSCWRRGPC
jgi:hypothetical protein